MKMFLVGIFDRKAQMFISLEPTPNINVSLRQLTENVNKESDNPLHKWSSDYALYELGEFDNENGRGAFHTDKKLIIECESLKTQG